jgi:hypothetical protein
VDDLDDGVVMFEIEVEIVGMVFGDWEKGQNN